ncbi:hypothetical protein A2W48_02315 [Candidatus Giovannonibacteria bacterium RIFCSPHIGHO2_12_44_12]|uniref:Uncharacterized protein n=2 Tax=Candidatus Giovannoniibacteriota TaxID=1752738 RepID=A0A1F5WYX0_9BACT|nr:MAG: hypothetical protein A2W48_02315 [Candidatus Giovannonibacteria bacterium RIFCSPHIGHO2_12_44_12]OGF86257.1 MAG: hypothetical protein A2Z63_01260 [Candidatus Giovannonibacteria bacterium RIFCSPLOWO2_02_44_8]
MNGIQSRIREAMDIPLINPRELEARVAAQEKTIGILKAILRQSKRTSRKLWEHNKLLVWKNQETKSLRQALEELRDQVYGQQNGP